MNNVVVRALIPPLAIAASTAIALAVNAGQLVPGRLVPGLLLLVAVVISALVSRTAGILAAVGSTVVLNLFFFEGGVGLSLNTQDEVVTVAVYLAAALVVGTLVARNREARAQLELAEREARLRIEVGNQLLAGEPLGDVVSASARSVSEMFGLARCTLTTAGEAATHDTGQPGGETLSITTEEATIDAVVANGNTLSPASERTLASLTSGLGTVFARTGLERAAASSRVDAEVNRARAAFFAAAGHNLRTPLTTVGASVAALLDSGDQLTARQQQELLETMREETSRLERMVAKVLDQSTIRGTRLEPDLEPVDLAGMVQVAISRLGPLGSRHRIELSVPAEVGPLWLDVTMLEQILLNLLENAVRFAPGGSTIAVTSQRRADGIELRVVDTGPGVDEAERDAIFEEFHRSPVRTEGEGSGLGLAIVRALVEAQGGRVHCEPTPGGGATFVVLFPLTGAGSEPASQPTQTGETP